MALPPCSRQNQLSRRRSKFGDAEVVTASELRHWSHSIVQFSTDATVKRIVQSAITLARVLRSISLNQQTNYTAPL
eukprot:6172823-Pleurochrysis_carterae.AAC.1